MVLHVLWKLAYIFIVLFGEALRRLHIFHPKLNWLIQHIGASKSVRRHTFISFRYTIANTLMHQRDHYDIQPCEIIKHIAWNAFFLRIASATPPYPNVQLVDIESYYNPAQIFLYSQSIFSRFRGEQWVWLNECRERATTLLITP